jgi:hypothetical protein
MSTYKQQARALARRVPASAKVIPVDIVVGDAFTYTLTTEGRVVVNATGRNITPWYRDNLSTAGKVNAGKS